LPALPAVELIENLNLGNLGNPSLQYRMKRPASENAGNEIFVGKSSRVSGWAGVIIAGRGCPEGSRWR
jgi:hypothetical protein